MDKEQLAIARLQDAARLSEHRYKKPLMVTYSGGKDSQVLVALAERAGINFEVVNSHTTADAPETAAYLRGETLPGDAEGWVVICTDGCPLGWAKGAGGVLKNHYPKGLRRLK